MREVVAQAERPVLLYSIGKDSSVLLHLARKAFYPGKLPFPLLHVDTTWKFRDMYAFRDEIAEAEDIELLVYVNEEGVAQGIGPFTHGSAVHTDVMKTEALKQALDAYGFDAAIGGARRDEERSRAKERIFSFRSQAAPAGIRRTSAPSSGGSTTRASTRASRCASSRSRTGPSSTSGTTSTARRSRSCRSTSRRSGPVVERDGQLILVDDERMPLEPGEEPALTQGALPHARLLPAVGRGRERGRDGAGDHPRDAPQLGLGAAGPRDRPRQRGLDGEEEAGGILLSAQRQSSDRRHGGLPRASASTRSCSASSRAAASTTARAR